MYIKLKSDLCRLLEGCCFNGFINKNYNIWSLSRDVLWFYHFMHLVWCITSDLKSLITWKLLLGTGSESRLIPVNWVVYRVGLSPCVCVYRAVGGLHQGFWQSSRTTGQGLELKYTVTSNHCISQNSIMLQTCTEHQWNKRYSI